MTDSRDGADDADPERDRAQAVADEVVELLRCGGVIDGALEDRILGDLDQWWPDESAGPYEGEGMIVPASDLPRWDPSVRASMDIQEGPWSLLADHVTEERYAALVHGDELPSMDERLFVARGYVEAAQTDSDFADVYSGADPRRLTDRSGNEAWILHLVKGFSFSGLDQEVSGPFATYGDVLAEIARLGFTSPEQVTEQDVA